MEAADLRWADLVCPFPAVQTFTWVCIPPSLQDPIVCRYIIHAPASWSQVTSFACHVHPTYSHTGWAPLGCPDIEPQLPLSKA